MDDGQIWFEFAWSARWAQAADTDPADGPADGEKNFLKISEAAAGGRRGGRGDKTKGKGHTRGDHPIRVRGARDQGWQAGALEAPRGQHRRRQATGGRAGRRGRVGEGAHAAAIAADRPGRAATHYCTACGMQSSPVAKRDNAGCGCLLTLLFLLPGLLWFAFAKVRLRCVYCGSESVIPVGSPMAQSLLRSQQPPPLASLARSGEGGSAPPVRD